MTHLLLRTQKGVTLIELMITISIIAILSTVGVSLMMDSRALQQLNGTTMEVLIGIQKARSVALKNNRDVLVRFDTVNGTYKAFINDGGDITTDSDLNGISDNAENDSQDSGEVSIFDGIVPGFVTISNANFSGNSHFIYTNKGFPNDLTGNAISGFVEFTNSTGELRRIEVYITGHAQIQ